jgi:hypothetical protein
MLVKSIPTVGEWRKSLQRNEALIRMVDQDAADGVGSIKKEMAVSCAEEHCQADATHVGIDCGNQCDSRQKKAHSSPAGASHMCISFVEQKRKKQLALEWAAAQCISGYEPFMAAVTEYDAVLANDDAFALYAKEVSPSAIAGRSHMSASCLCTLLMRASCPLLSCPAVCKTN